MIKIFQILQCLSKKICLIFFLGKVTNTKALAGFDLMSPITLKMKYLVPHIRYSEIFPTE